MTREELTELFNIVFNNNKKERETDKEITIQIKDKNTKDIAIMLLESGLKPTDIETTPIEFKND